MPYLFFLLEGVKKSNNFFRLWTGFGILDTFQKCPKRFKRDQDGQSKCFWPFGTLFYPYEPLWTISNKNNFFEEAPPLSIWTKPFIFVWNGPKWSRWAQKLCLPWVDNNSQLVGAHQRDGKEGEDYVWYSKGPGLRDCWHGGGANHECALRAYGGLFGWGVA